MENSKLFKQLQNYEETIFGAKKHPISINIAEHLYNVAKLILNRIPAYMPEYTLHDIGHCKEVLNIIDKIIPEGIELNIVEIQILIYAIFLHDIGMVINKDEAEKIKDTKEFKELLLEFDDTSSEDDILTEFIRRTHVKRSIEYIDLFKMEYSTYKINFDFKGIDLSDWIKNVIRSHEMSVEELDNELEFPKDKIIHEYSVNIQFIALLLRLGDILDFDIYRTPYFLYKHINLKNEISNDEWQKHLSIEGKIIKHDDIRFEAKCYSAKIERKVRNFANWIETERRDTMELLQKNSNPKYMLNLKKKVSLKVRNDGSYIFNELRLELDYKKVLNILMGTELYDSPDIFIREIIQNSYDACKFVEEKLDNSSYSYFPKINISLDSNKSLLTIEDNGIGMDSIIFKNYVTKIGNSYYRSKSFQKENAKFKPISNFGIGILSCFMVSDIIRIESLKYNSAIKHSAPIDYTLNIKNQYIDEKVGGKKEFGTKITLKLHDEYLKKLKENNLLEIIRDNILIQEIPILVNIDGEEDILDNKTIEIPDEYRRINGIEIIKIDNVDWLEGFIVIHKGEHQSLIGNSKIAQQGISITKKNRNTVNLNIPWLRNSKFFINILPPNLLSLKASRNDVKDDRNLLNLKNQLIDIITDYFSQKSLTTHNPTLIHSYIDLGFSPVLSGNNKEYNFLIEHVFFKVMNSNKHYYYSNFKGIYNSKESSLRIIVLNDTLFEQMRKENVLDEFLLEIGGFDYIISDIGHINYFFQFSKPYEMKNEIVVSDIPGVTYSAIIINKTGNLAIENYKDKSYSWNKFYNIIYRNKKNVLFCNISHIQHTLINLQINKKHKLGKMIENNKDLFYTKKFIGSLKSNIYAAVKGKTKLKKFIDYGGERFSVIDDSFPYSLNAIKFMGEEFIESMNEHLQNEVFPELAEKQLINLDEFDNYLLTEEDFPTWWIDDKKA